MSDKSHVSMEQHQCPVCGTIHNTNALLIDKRGREVFDRYTVTGLSPCDDCQSRMDDGYVALVAVVPKGSDGASTFAYEREELNPSEVSYTGAVAWISRQAWVAVFNPGTPLPPEDRAMAYVQPEVIEELERMYAGLRGVAVEELESSTDGGSTSVH